jgi:hypothetical protein
MQHFDQQDMWANVGQIEEIAFLDKAEALIEASDVGSPVAPDLGRQWLRADSVDERLKDFPTRPGSAHVFLDSHATNTPTHGVRSLFAWIRQERADPDELPIQENADVQGTRRGIARIGTRTKRLMRSEDTMAQIIGFFGANGTSLDG